VLHSTRLDPRYLELEITETETVLMRDVTNLWPEWEN
jgi:EAL domain-containing protein (putative c-di-GMP-specific phosphodiesterase class I)